MSAAIDVTACRAEFRRAAARVRVLPYVPGFGGHGPKRGGCSCTIADELICGRTHPDKRESADAILRRKESALVVAEREARHSAWIADLFGTGAEREHRRPAPYKRSSEAAIEKRQPARADRPLSDSESRQALQWMRAKKLTRALAGKRKSIACQAWIELRRPPASSTPVTFFLVEVERAWWRAIKVVQAEDETAWHLPAPDLDRERDQ